MIRPLGENATIRPVTEEKTDGGILIPETAIENRAYHRGVVVAVGSGLPGFSGGRIPLEVKPGDNVFYRFGEDIKDGKEVLKLVREKDIIAIIEEG